jgi:hypothetical protein
MKTMRKFGIVALVAALLSAGAVGAQDAYGWILSRISGSDSASNFVSAVSTDTAALVQYVGSQTSGLVAIAANGDLTFTQGALSSEVATTEFECPVSGALGGVIDVSDTACDTLGEVADVINNSTSWRFVLLDSMRADSSNDTLVTISATQAATTDGLALLHDAAVGFKATRALLPRSMRTMPFYVDGRTSALKPKPFEGLQGALMRSIATSTYASGTSTFEVWSVAVTNTARGSAGGSVGSETRTQLWSEAGGATTAAKTFDFQALGLHGNVGEKLVARLNNSAAMSAVTMPAWALFYPARR